MVEVMQFRVSDYQFEALRIQKIALYLPGFLEEM